MTPEQLAEMTGEGQYRKSKLLTLKSLKLNGDDGAFYITHLDEPKREDGKYRKEKIVGVPEVVFLKVRRRLIESSKDGLVLQTTEHNTPDDTVLLYNKESKQPERATARFLRENYDSLRTEQIVYVRYKSQIMRLYVKGASLGSDAKAKTTTSFYSYLSSFKGDDHWYNVRTKLVPIEERGARTYYCIDFQRGTDLDDNQRATVITDIETVYNSCKEFDASFQTVAAEVATTPQRAEQSKSGDFPGEYPEEEINPDDIPF